MISFISLLGGLANIMKIKFSKFHGFSNDYVVIEAEQLTKVSDLASFTKLLCDRHKGVGSDGIAILEKIDESDADFSCRIINPDGEEADFSGNGSRCAVSYAYFKGLWKAENLRLQMMSGIKNFRLIEEISRGHYWFEAESGKPKFASDEIPFAVNERLESVIDEQFTINKELFTVSCVNVGNPVACIFVDKFNANWKRIGKKLEPYKKKFPKKANIAFVKILDFENIELKIWERGAGETSASGTCASGAAILTAFRGETGRKVWVKSEGGTTKITWRDDDEILILGRADFVFSGEYSIKDQM